MLRLYANVMKDTFYDYIGTHKYIGLLAKGKKFIKRKLESIKRIFFSSNGCKVINKNTSFFCIQLANNFKTIDVCA